MNGNGDLVELFTRAVEATESARARLLAELRATDPALASRLEELLAAAARKSSLLDDPLGAVGAIGSPDAEAEAPPPERIGPYRIRREIGRGGMGRVFLAEQEGEGFRRPVALKVLAASRLGEEAARSFRVERRILASLEHPGIARFLDGGRSPEGAVYLALEYVEGENLIAYAQSRQLGIAERLRLFLGVLEAVQFAHSRLVVHRDLKPANILVGTDGRPRLLDFGISKLLDPGETADLTVTHGELRALTPAYASPEQVRGEPVSVGSDVYSLGVVLYELLTGERPYRVSGGSPLEWQRAVLEEEPAAPSTAARHLRLDADLDAIVLAAMRKEPQARYGSVEALAADVRRYLDGRPVLARQGGRRYRLAKLVRRHRVLLAAAALAGLGLATGLSVALWQRSTAIAQRELAERRFADVQEMARSLLFDVHDEIRELPGSLPVRERIVERALAYLERLEEEAGEDRELLATLASGYERIGGVSAGDPSFGSALTGNAERGERAFARALAIRRRLVTLDDGSRASREALASVLSVYGEAGRTLGRRDEMRRLREEAVAVRRQLAAEEPGDPDLAFELALELLHRAHGERTLAPDSPAEVEARRVALAALPPLLRSPPPLASREPLRWAEYLVGAAGFLLTEGRFGDAELATRLALAAVESRPATGRDRGRESLLAALYGTRTKALMALARPHEAIEAARRGIALHRAWLDEPESRPTHVINLFWLLTEAMDLALETGAVEGAGGLIEEAEALAREEGWSGGHGQVALGMLAERRGDLHAALAGRAVSVGERVRHREAARAAYGEALRLFEQNAAGGADDLDVAESLPALRAKLRAVGRAG